ncbi:hypothetical protein KNE206_34890 [Kitasatospora sp. NE20-6]
MAPAGRAPVHGGARRGPHGAACALRADPSCTDGLVLVVPVIPLLHVPFTGPFRAPLPGGAR